MDPVKIFFVLKACIGLTHDHSVLRGAFTKCSLCYFFLFGGVHKKNSGNGAFLPLKLIKNQSNQVYVIAR